MNVEKVFQGGVILVTTTYSQLDLIGGYLRNSKEGFFDKILQVLDVGREIAELEFSLEKIVYLRILTYSKVVSKSAGLKFGPGELIKVIIHHYINNYYRYNNTKKYSELLSKGLDLNSGYLVTNHMTNEKYLVKNEEVEKYRIKLEFDKDTLLKGEVLLAEINEIHLVYSTLENFVEVI